MVNWAALERLSDAWRAVAAYEEVKPSRARTDLRIAVDTLYRMAYFGLSKPRYYVSKDMTIREL
jgi:hypothetical protein